MPRTYPFHAGEGYKVVYSVHSGPAFPHPGDVTSEPCVLFLLFRALSRRGLVMSALLWRAYPQGLPFSPRQGAPYCAPDPNPPLSLLLDDLSDCNLHALRREIEAVLGSRPKS